MKKEPGKDRFVVLILAMTRFTIFHDHIIRRGDQLVVYFGLETFIKDISDQII